ncbi:MAG: TlpA disulfide reductase family protein [Burkholderiaceae bacterium]|nr:TlpA disulfide reductase family protein [Burkholderiaceae bacterium]
MKFRTYLAGAVLSLTLPLAATAQQVGQPAPSFDLPGSASAVRLADMKGKVVYLDFWASWCAPCKQSFPWMNEMQAKYGSAGFLVVAISVDAKRSDAEEFLKGTPAQFTVAFDTKGESPKTYAIKGMPSSFLIGPDGRVIATHTGFKDADRKALEDKIREALKR